MIRARRPAQLLQLARGGQQSKRRGGDPGGPSTRTAMLPVPGKSSGNYGWTTFFLQRSVLERRSPLSASPKRGQRRRCATDTGAAVSPHRARWASWAISPVRIENGERPSKASLNASARPAWSISDGAWPSLTRGFRPSAPKAWNPHGLDRYCAREHVLRVGSNSGNISADALAAAGPLDILPSFYERRSGRPRGRGGKGLPPNRG
jgi:hypothetical protein